MAQAWEAVKEETISKCFRKAGILDENCDAVSREHEDQDPFDELDSGGVEIQQLIDQLNMPTETKCSAREYVNGDDDLPTCSEVNCH